MKKQHNLGKNILWASGILLAVCLILQGYTLLSNIHSIFDLDNGRLLIMKKVFYLEGYPQLQMEFDARESLFSSISQCTTYFVEPKLADVEEYELIKHKYDVVFADSKNIVGVLDQSLMPNQPVVMCDFESKKCFPCDVTDKERQVMFEKLKKENHQLEPPICLDEWMCKSEANTP